MTSSGQPFVSVIIPVFNGMPYLAETIESVRHQTYPNWELVICDNQSTDATASFVEELIRTRPDPRIRLVLADEHLPMVPNWNRALGEARHDLIKMLPSDDILLPSCLEIQVRQLAERPNIGFVTAGKILIDSKGKKLFTKNLLKEGVYDWNTIGLKSVCEVSNNLGEPGGVLFRSSLVKTCGVFDPQLKYFLDMDLWLRFLRVSQLQVNGQPLYQFRLHGQSISSASRRRAVDEYQEWLGRFENELELTQRPWFRRYLYAKSWAITYLRSLVFKFVGWRERISGGSQP